MDVGYLFANTTGRIPRRDCWIGVLVLAGVGVVIFLMLMSLINVFSPLGRAILFLIQLILAYPAYALFAKRFQDRNEPGNLALVGIGIWLLKALLDLLGLTGANILGYVLWIAFGAVVLWYLIELGFLRGTVGPNIFGDDPLGAPEHA